MRPHHRTDGFTLAEMAIVLVIIALLLGGLLAPLGAQMESRQRTENEKTLADIREALIGFAIVNGRLPCPATRTVATGTGGGTCPGAAGCEAVTGSGSTLACTNATGVLPWATLGLSETDAWNNRFTYRVSLTFGRGVPQTTVFGCTPSAPPTSAAFALCSPGNITIQTSTGTSLASQIPAIVVSHGRNGLGAWLPTGAQIGGAGGDENENADDDTVFVSDTSIDDQLVWVPTNILMNRMIAAGKLP